jgi:hypothetical protein
MANINLDPGQHYWTGVADRHNSDAGTEGMIRELHEYRDIFGPNEILAPVAVIYSYPESTSVQMTTITTPAPIPEPGTALMLVAGLVVAMLMRRL